MIEGVPMIKKLLNKSLLQIFFALILLMCIMFVSNYVVFRNSMSAMYSQTRANNMVVTENIIRSFDDYFKEVNNNIINAINNQPYQMYDSDGHNNLNMFNTFMFLRNIKQLVAEDFIEEFIVYYSDSSLAVTSKGTESFNSIFDNRYKNTNYATQYWMNFANTKHPLKYIPAADYTETTSSGEVYERKLIGLVGNNQTSNGKMNIVVFIDVDKLLKRVNQQNMMKGTSLVVLDQDKNVILKTGEDYNVNSLESVYFQTDSGKAVKKGGFEYFTTKSAYNDFIYINKIPQTYTHILSVAKTNQIILALTILLGIFISVLLSAFLYSPIKKILKLIGISSNDDSRSHYKHIYNSIEQIKRENLIIKSHMDEVDKEVRRSIFFKMVDDITYYKNFKDQIDTYFKVIFYNQQFLMVLFYLQPGKESNEEMPLSPEDMANNIQEVLRRRIESSVVFYAENMQYIALVGIDKGWKKDAAAKQIQETVDDLKADTFPNYRIIAALSRVYSEAQQCKAAFKDTKTCLANRSLRQIKAVIDIEKLDNKFELYFPLNFTEKFSNYVLSGNTQETLKLVSSVLDKNIENNISYIKYINIISDIFNDFINTLTFYGYNRSDIEKYEYEFMELINNMSDYEEIQRFLTSAIKQATGKISDKGQSKLSKEFIVQYINLHYPENLYLENMAEIVGTTPKYFSNFFKKAMGVNFVEYLNRVKILHAKEMLKNTDIPISEIGEKTGYINSSTFTSTFKKYSGVSPTEYRKEHRH